MGAICGVIDHFAEKEHKRIGQLMLDELSHFKFDRMDSFANKELYFGCGFHYITPESEYEFLPQYDSDMGLVITADAIIDNRTELLREFGMSKQDTVTDSELILNAYAKWGKNCVKFLIGDFAFAIWDAKKKELFCARDHVGTRTLYYTMSDNAFMFCTLMRPIIKASSDRIELNEKWIADCLALDHLINEIECNETPYKGIYQIPPASTLIFGKGDIYIEKYWDPLREIKPLKLKTDEEYVNAFKKVFFEAVHCRLRSKENVGIMLSGGLDSASIASVAANMLRNENKKLYSFTSIPIAPCDDHPQYYIPDESKEVELLSKHCGNIETEFLKFEGKNCVSDMEEVISILEQPYKTFRNMYWMKGILEQGKKKKCRIMLNGQFGNFTISYGNFYTYYRTLFTQGKFITIAKEIMALSREINMPVPQVIRKLKDVFIPYFIRRIHHLVTQKNENMFKNVIINMEMVERWNIKKRLRAAGYNQIVIPYNTMQKEFGIVLNPCVLSHLGTMESKLSLANGLVIRDPSRDKRVIEFCLSLPVSQYVRGGKQRILIRRAMEGSLPDEIRMNFAHRGIQSYDWRIRLEPDWQTAVKEIKEIMGDPLISKYLDTEKLRKICTECEQQHYSKRNAYSVHLMITSLILYKFFKYYNDMIED